MKKSFFLLVLTTMVLLVSTSALAFVQYTYYDAATDSYLPLTEGCTVELQSSDLILKPEGGEDGVLYRTVVEGQSENGWFTDCHAYTFENAVLRMYDFLGRKSETIETTLTDQPGEYGPFMATTLRGYDKVSVSFYVNIKEGNDLSDGKYGVLKEYKYAREPEFYPIEIEEKPVSMEILAPVNGSKLIGYPNYALNIVIRVKGNGKVKVFLIDEESNYIVMKSEHDTGWMSLPITVTHSMMGKSFILRLECDDQIAESRFTLEQEP